jgi:hypothetical protein
MFDVGNIPLGGGYRIRPSIFILQHRDGQPDVQHPAIPGDALCLERPDNFASPQPVHHFFIRGLLAFRDYREDVHLKGLRLRVTVYLFGTMVPGKNVPPHVQEDNGVVGIDDNCSQPLYQFRIR